MPFCMHAAQQCPTSYSSRNCLCCKFRHYGMVRCKRECSCYCSAKSGRKRRSGCTGRAPATPSPTTAATPPFLEDMITDDAPFLIWPDSSEEMFAIFDENTGEIRTSTLETKTIDFASFLFRRKLCKEEFSISIESKLFPGKFWNNQDSIIKLTDKEDTDQFKDDSCFNVVNAGCRVGSFALQSTKFEKLFIQKEDSRLKLISRSDNLEKMCWANPVSQQQSLAYCATNVTSEEDVYEHPECCDHEGTLEEFGGCCNELQMEGETCTIQLHICYKIVNSGQPESVVTMMLHKFPFCCRIRLLRNLSMLNKVCQKLGHSSIGLKSNLPQFKGNRLKCGMKCRTIDHCPWKMRSEEGWTNSDDKCCCHPFRKKIMLKNNLDYLNIGECKAKGYQDILG